MRNEFRESIANGEVREWLNGVSIALKTFGNRSIAIVSAKNLNRECGMRSRDGARKSQTSPHRRGKSPSFNPIRGRGGLRPAG